jgi:hypothetical protein
MPTDAEGTQLDADVEAVAEAIWRSDMKPRPAEATWADYVEGQPAGAEHYRVLARAAILTLAERPDDAAQ